MNKLNNLNKTLAQEYGKYQEGVTHERGSLIVLQPYCLFHSSSGFSQNNNKKNFPSVIKASFLQASINDKHKTSLNLIRKIITSKNPSKFVNLPFGDEKNQAEVYILKKKEVMAAKIQHVALGAKFHKTNTIKIKPNFFFTNKIISHSDQSSLYFTTQSRNNFIGNNSVVPFRGVTTAGGQKEFDNNKHIKTKIFFNKKYKKIPIVYSNLHKKNDTSFLREFKKSVFPLFLNSHKKESLPFISNISTKDLKQQTTKVFQSSYSKMMEINLITIRLASANRIRQWAEKTLPNGKVVGEVINPETVHYKTLKPIKAGLFCERIFGPLKDHECACGKKFNIKNYLAKVTSKNILSQKLQKRYFCRVCDVEYTYSIIRRTQLGFIQLASPTTHVWFVKGIPSYISILLDMKKKHLQNVTYNSETLTLEHAFRGRQYLPSSPSSIFESWQKIMKIQYPEKYGDIQLPGAKPLKITKGLSKDFLSKRNGSLHVSPEGILPRKSLVSKQEVVPPQGDNYRFLQKTNKKSIGSSLPQRGKTVGGQLPFPSVVAIPPSVLLLHPLKGNKGQTTTKLLLHQKGNVKKVYSNAKTSRYKQNKKNYYASLCLLPLPYALASPKGEQRAKFLSDSGQSSYPIRGKATTTNSMLSLSPSLLPGGQQSKPEGTYLCPKGHNEHNIKLEQGTLGYIKNITETDYNGLVNQKGSPIFLMSSEACYAPLKGKHSKFHGSCPPTVRFFAPEGQQKELPANEKERFGSPFRAQQPPQRGNGSCPPTGELPGWFKLASNILTLKITNSSTKANETVVNYPLISFGPQGGNIFISTQNDLQLLITLLGKEFDCTTQVFPSGQPKGQMLGGININVLLNFCFNNSFLSSNNLAFFYKHELLNLLKIKFKKLPIPLYLLFLSNDLLFFNILRTKLFYGTYKNFLGGLLRSPLGCFPSVLRRVPFGDTSITTKLLLHQRGSDAVPWKGKKDVLVPSNAAKIFTNKIAVLKHKSFTGSSKGAKNAFDKVVGVGISGLSVIADHKPSFFSQELLSSSLLKVWKIFIKKNQKTSCFLPPNNETLPIGQQHIKHFINSLVGFTHKTKQIHLLSSKEHNSLKTSFEQHALFLLTKSLKSYNLNFLEKYTTKLAVMLLLNLTNHMPQRGKNHLTRIKSFTICKKQLKRKLVQRLHACYLFNQGLDYFEQFKIVSKKIPYLFSKYNMIKNLGSSPVGGQLPFQSVLKQIITKTNKSWPLANYNIDRHENALSQQPVIALRPAFGFLKISNEIYQRNMSSKERNLVRQRNGGLPPSYAERVTSRGLMVIDAIKYLGSLKTSKKLTLYFFFLKQTKKTLAYKLYNSLIADFETIENKYLKYLLVLKTFFSKLPFPFPRSLPLWYTSGGGKAQRATGWAKHNKIPAGDEYKLAETKNLIVNNIYTLSHRELWEQEKDWQDFAYYYYSPTNITDIPIPLYKHRNYDLLFSIDNTLTYTSTDYYPAQTEFYSLGMNINTAFSGAGLIQKLLNEFNYSELKKMDKQNRILLFEYNKHIKKLKKMMNSRLIKSRLEYYKACHIRDVLIRRTKLTRKIFNKAIGSSPAGGQLPFPYDVKMHQPRNGSSPPAVREGQQKELPRVISASSGKQVSHTIETNGLNMILTLLPVLPPVLRPVLKMAGQFTISDLNRLYQRIIYRNERLKKFLKDPALSSSFEMKYAQRLLQEAVDNLIQNGKSGVVPEKDARGRLLKSLSDILKGKQGRFRQYLLGKRVDYSGRSVIVVGPRLKLHECGIPKEMALVLYSPFLIKRILNEKLADTYLSAKKLIQTNPLLVSQLLREIMKAGPVLLNRAPTLHRLGFQAFQPKLVDGKAILLHPLVCPAFNADFDGDQMAVHVPITFEARAEAWKLMLARNNLLSPATGEPIILPSQDMVLGCYYLTTNCAEKWSKFKKGSGMYFHNINDVLKAYNQQLIHVHAILWVNIVGHVENANTLEQPLEIRISLAGFKLRSFPPVLSPEGKVVALPSGQPKGQNKGEAVAQRATACLPSGEMPTPEGIKTIMSPRGASYDVKDNFNYIEIYSKSHHILNFNGTLTNQIIRTTPGKILFNMIIKNAIEKRPALLSKYTYEAGLFKNKLINAFDLETTNFFTRKKVI